MSTDAIALAPPAIAEAIGVTPQTLKRWRSKGIGPPYARLDSGQVRYRVADVDAWLAANTVVPHSD